MATLALSIVGQVVGDMILPGIGGTIGRAIGAVGGAFIDQALMGETASAPRTADTTAVKADTTNVKADRA